MAPFPMGVRVAWQGEVVWPGSHRWEMAHGLSPKPGFHLLPWLLLDQPAQAVEGGAPSHRSVLWRTAVLIARINLC